MNKQPTVVGFSQIFKRDLKRLIKKYHHIENDINPFLETLKNGETPGDQIPGIGYPVYKERLPNRDSQSGQSGGYRVIYYLRTATEVLILTIYVKSEQSDIALERIRSIIAEEIEPPVE